MSLSLTTINITGIFELQQIHERGIRESQLLLNALRGRFDCLGMPTWKALGGFSQQGIAETICAIHCRYRTALTPGRCRLGTLLDYLCQVRRAQFHTFPLQVPIDSRFLTPLLISHCTAHRQKALWQSGEWTRIKFRCILHCFRSRNLPHARLRRSIFCVLLADSSLSCDQWIDVELHS